MTNEELYQKMRGGDADAFEQLYEQLENFHPGHRPGRGQKIWV